MLPAGLLGQQQQLLLNRDVAARVAAAHSSAFQRALPLAQQAATEAHELLARAMWPTAVTILRARHHGLTGGSTKGAAAALFPSAVWEEYRLTPFVPVRPPSAESQRPEIVSRVAVIRDLIQKEQISAARMMLDVISIGAFEEPAMKRLRRALTPPAVRRSDLRDTARTHAWAWLRQHGREYQGQWVAVAEHGLIAAAPTLKQLRAQIRALAPAEQPLIHKL